MDRHMCSWRPTSRWSRRYALSQRKPALDETLLLGEDAILQPDLEAQPLGFLSENKASWLLLLQFLYQACIAHDVRPGEARHDGVGRPEEVGLGFIEWTWDVLPKDTNRPMAKTTLGELVILGYRLGMRWRIDLDKQSFAADGNGFSLICSQVPEKGLIASFTARRWNPVKVSYPNLIFNRHAEKLMCGIITGATSLVGRDLYCTAGRGIDVLAALLDQFDVEGDLGAILSSEEIDTKNIKHPSTVLVANEAATLLCEFLPVHEAGSNARRHFFHGWNSGTGGHPFSVLWSKAGRSYLLAYLKDRRSKYRRSRVTREVLDTLQTLSRRYPWAFEDELDEDPEGDLVPEGDQAILVPDCRREWDATTTGFFGYERSYNGITHYTRLVLAHCCMSVRASKSALLRQSAELSDFRAHKHQLQDIAEAYLKQIYDDKGLLADGIFKRCTQTIRYELYGVTSIHVDRETETLDNWWLMMLRGIVWSMSTDVTTAEGEAVPSSCFGSERPVWIT